MNLAKRSEVPAQLTWDLTLLYENEAVMEQDMEKMRALCARMEETYCGALTTPQAINDCLDDLREITRLTSLLGNYGELAVSVDYGDSHNQRVSDRITQLLAEVGSRLSFIDSQIVEQSETVLQQAMDMAKENKLYLADVLRKKPYQLHLDTEKTLAALAPAFGTPYQVYNLSKLADIRFPAFTVNGKTYPLGYSLFEDDYEYETDTQVRRTAFATFSEKIREYENVTAGAYNAQVRTEKILSDLRGFPTVFDSLLFPQKVTREMYDRQIDLITTKLAPHMRKYARLLQKIHKLDKITFADLKIAVDPEYDPSVTIEASRTYIEEGLSIMGEDYVAMIREAYDKRWIDFAKNQGKSTGGFCSSPYGKNSFILLNWNERMADVFVLAHELGHAGHFKSCNSTQSVFDTDVSCYFVEAPSTMNELLLAQHLLKTSTDKRFRRWVLSCMISRTYYHNFVTHLLEADYQRKVYALIDQGGSVQAETLSRLMRETLENFWGEDVEILPGAELTWMRQPHYYMGLYSYTYSAGLTVATQVAARMEKEGQSAVEDWKKVLAAGSTGTPLELAKLAGVDISTDRPLLDTIETIGNIVEEICRLTEELEAEGV